MKHIDQNVWAAWTIGVVVLLLLILVLLAIVVLRQGNRIDGLEDRTTENENDIDVLLNRTDFLVLDDSDTDEEPEEVRHG